MVATETVWPTKPKIFTIQFFKEKIYIPWSIRNYKNHKLDFSNSIYPVIFYYYGERNKKSNEMHFNYSILNYTLCSETDLKKYFYSDSISFDDYYCITVIPSKL